MISSENLFYKNIKSKYIIFIIILFGVALRLIYLNQLDDYYDDWNFLFTVDPNISNEITWVRYYGDRRVLEQYNSYDYQKVGEGFSYNSKDNDSFLSINEIRDLINEHKFQKQ